MPLDPSISLQGRPISISGTDPMQTLMTVAQLKQMQSQDQLRQLQAQQIQQGLGEYQRLQAPLAEWRAMNQGQGAPGMVAGPQLATQPPAALGPPPAQQAPMNGAPMSPAPLYDQLSPGTQALYPNGPPPDAGQVLTGAPPGQGGLPLTMDIAKPSADTPPQAPPQQSANGIPSMENIVKRVQLLQQINAVGPNYGPAMATSMMALDKHELEMKKQLLENHIKGINATNELFAGVNDQTGYDESKRLAALVGSTEVAQLPERFDDPRAKQWLAYRRTIGQTQQQRIEAEQKRIDQALTFFEHETGRMAEERTRRKVTPIPGAGGYALQRETPEPGTTGTTPMEIGGQAVVPPGAAEYTTFLDAQNNPVLLPKTVAPGQPIRGQRPVLPGAGPPAYSAERQAALPSPGGAASGLQTPEMRMKTMEPGLATQTEMMKTAGTEAEGAVKVQQVIRQMKALMHQGAADTSILTPAAIEAYRSRNVVLKGFDQNSLARAAELLNLGDELTKLAQGDKGIRVGPTEINVLKGASGNMGSPQPRALVFGMMDRLQEQANERLTRGNQLKVPSATGQPYTPRQMIPKAQFEQAYAQAKQQDPTLTKDTFAHRIEAATGAHIMEGP